MLFPKKVKYRRWQRSRGSGFNRLGVRNATRNNEVTFGEYGMKALTNARVRSNQIEAARRVISRTLGKGTKVWIRVFPDRPWTQKAAEVGMGKGKGDPKGYEAEVLPGCVVFEVSGASEELSRLALTKAGKKLPIRIKVVKSKK